MEEVRFHTHNPAAGELDERPAGAWADLVADGTRSGVEKTDPVAGLIVVLVEAGEGSKGFGELVTLRLEVSAMQARPVM